MFDLWKLKYERRKTVRFYDKIVATAKGDKTRSKEDLESLYAEEAYFIGEVDNALNAFVSDRLIEEAREFDVETPKISDASALWEKDWTRQRYFLSATGRSTIRKLIDEEKARRFEVTTRWVKLLTPVIAACAGLIGVITGLVAVLRRK
jgi:hypothetical protein